MTKEKKCIDLVNKNYQSRLKQISNAYNNENLDIAQWLSEYGLSWDYVVSDTFDNQSEGYYRWQLSWGGPGDEFRIYTDNDKNIKSVEYWYLDWFDGASIRVHDDVIYHICQMFLDCSEHPEPNQYELEELEYETV